MKKYFEIQKSLGATILDRHMFETTCSTDRQRFDICKQMPFLFCFCLKPMSKKKNYPFLILHLSFALRLCEL